MNYYFISIQVWSYVHVYHVYLNRGLVYQQQCLIQNLKWKPGFQLVSPQANSQMLSCTDFTGTHLEAIWGSNPFAAASGFYFFLPVPSSGSRAPCLHPDASSHSRLKEAFKGLWENAREAVLARPRGCRSPVLKSTVRLHAFKQSRMHRGK